MEFDKTGMIYNRQFTYGRLQVENVQSYEYLGVHVNNNGNWSVAKQQIHLKTLKAMFALKRSVGYNGDIKPHVGLKLYDQLIRPIRLKTQDSFINTRNNTVHRIVTLHV